MRKPLIAGNWKMHGTLSFAEKLSKEIAEHSAHFTDIDILLLPTFIQLKLVAHYLTTPSLYLGAQNLYLAKEGAYTGEISAMMLKEVGCQYVLIGHSERRIIFNETNELLARKFKAAQEEQLYPILCVGETLQEREGGLTEKVIEEQINAVVSVNGIDSFKEAIIAYEPVWAIGTGLTAKPLDAQKVHEFIRELIEGHEKKQKNKVELAHTIRILYGGSMKAENAHALLAMPDIDGGLIGGASLEAASFLAICEAANQIKKAASF